MNERQQFCSFHVDNLLFGVDVHKVQEVIRHLDITRVPSAPPSVRGLINLSSQIIAAIDVRRCLDLPDRLPHGLFVHLICRTEDGPVSFLVDEIGEVLELAEDALAFSPEALNGRLRECVCDAYKLPDRLLLVLDTERMLRAASAAECGATPGGAR